MLGLMFMEKEGKSDAQMLKIKNDVRVKKVREETIFVPVPEEICRPTYLE